MGDKKKNPGQKFSAKTYVITAAQGIQNPYSAHHYGRDASKGEVNEPLLKNIERFVKDHEGELEICAIPGAYVNEIELDKSNMYGTGLLNGVVAYKNSTGEILNEQLSFILDLANLSLTKLDDNGSYTDDNNNVAINNNENIEKSLIIVEQNNGIKKLRLILNNSNGGKYYYSNTKKDIVLNLSLSLEISDIEKPPYDLLLDIVIQPFCEKPLLTNPEKPDTSNKNCILKAEKSTLNKDHGCFCNSI